MTAPRRPSVSIIIPTYNSARTLGACLDSCLAQGVDPNDIIVIDDSRTTDATPDIAKTRGVTLIVSPAGLSESRNVGVAQAKQPMLLHIDSDMRLEMALVQAALAKMDLLGADALTIAEHPVGFGPWVAARSIDKAVIEASGIGRSARMMTREAFDFVGGYDERLTAGEDQDLHGRLEAAGFQIGHLASPGIEHEEGSLKLKDAWGKKLNYGRTATEFAQKHGTNVVSPRDGVARIWMGLRHSDPLSVRLRFLTLKSTEWAAFAAGRALTKSAATFRSRALSSSDEVAEPVVAVICCSTLPASPSGGDVLAIRVAECLAADGHRVVLVTTPEARELYEIADSQLEVVQVATTASGSPTRTYLRRMLQGARELARGRRGSLRAAVIASYYPPDLLAGITATVQGARVILSWQLDIPNPLRATYAGPRTRDNRPDRRELLRQAASYVLQEFALIVGRLLHWTVLTPHSISAQRLRGLPVLRNSYVADRPRRSDAGRPIIERDIDCLFVGRFHPQKGLEDVARVWRHIDRIEPGVHNLVVVGEGPAQQRAILARMSERSASAVTLMGTVTGAAKLELMCRAKVLLFPSTYESFGLVVDEALACGTPVAAYALPCLADRVANVLDLVQIGDTSGLSQTVERYLHDNSAWEAAHLRALEYSFSRSWRSALSEVSEILGHSLVR